MKMPKEEFDLKEYLFYSSKNIKDYIQLIRTNLSAFLAIYILIFAAAVAYIILTPRIYESTVSLKIKKQKGSVLQSNSEYENTAEEDRFISNELEIINKYDTRVRVAKALIDSIKSENIKPFLRLMKFSAGEADDSSQENIYIIANILKDNVKAEQKTGMDIVDITARSTSPEEAALIANTYAEQYKQLNLEENRSQLTAVRKFLEKQTKDKLTELNEAASEMAEFKQKGRIVSLDAQSSALVAQLSQLDAERDAAKIDLISSDEMLDQYKKQISAQDPHLANYLEGQTSQAYINQLQLQIAELQTNKDMALAIKNPDIDVSSQINQYDKRINDLKGKLRDKINEIKSGAFSSSPEQVKNLTQKMIEEEVRNRSLSMKLDELQSIIGNYEGKLSTLPKKSMQFAGYERNLESLQQLYTLVDQRYQQAMINELSQPGDVMIIGKGWIPDKPSKPSIIIIIVIGLLGGFAGAFGFILVKDYFDDTVKTPDDIQKKDFNLLVWIPQFKKSNKESALKNELVVLNDPRSTASEAFKALGARLMMMKSSGSKSSQSILVSSPGEGEGKTMVAVNLAYSMAQLRKKTLLIDCDLRKPRIHKIMITGKAPGLTDILSGKTTFKDAYRQTELTTLGYLTAGTISSNSTEVLSSSQMGSLLDQLKPHFDFIILDSAPVVAVVDTELLAKYVDGVMLVVSADSTETRLMEDAIGLIKNTGSPILGTVLNNFRYKNGYKYYRKYYYNYPAGKNGNSGAMEKA
jgi:polysaccharide biosynthesis transport protein